MDTRSSNESAARHQAAHAGLETVLDDPRDGCVIDRTRLIERGDDGSVDAFEIHARTPGSRSRETAGGP
jgi:hypothetical protein